MKMNKICFIEIKNYLLKHAVHIKSNIKDNESFSNIGSLKNSNKYELTFFHNKKYLDQLKNTSAKACFINYDCVQYLNSSCYPIVVENPYQAFALISNLMHPRVISNSIIKNSVVIHKTSLIENNVQINDNVIIKENCKIHKNSIILENSVIGPNVEIFSDNYIMSSCVISNATIGNKCVIQHGSIIGGKGFGFTPKDKIEIQHIGNVIIGNNVDIGSNTTIDRGAVDSTIINDNVRIDNLVQIAHNVTIGKNSIIASQTGIAGSTNIGFNCVIGGQVGIAGHLNIGNNVRIAAKSGVTKDIPDNLTIAGFPALDIKKWRKIIVNQYKIKNDN